MKILCSACLLGVPCRYDGKSCYHPAAEALCRDHEVIPVCPELFGGLPIPRKPIELSGGRVVTAEGEDCTEQVRKGIELSLQAAGPGKPDLAVLQQKSPSCGYGKIYDGTFSSKLIEGSGLFAQALTEAGIPIISSDRLDELPALLKDESF